MDRLADELLKMIITPPLLVPDELFADGGDLSPFSKAMFSASEVLLVCKRFMRIATPVLYETVIIRTKAQAFALQAALTRNPEFGQFVRKLRLESAYGRELGKVIRVMPHVTDFCFTLSVFADESISALTAGFNTFEPTRVILTLLDGRRGTNALHRTLVGKLCAAIRNWTKLRHFSYAKATRWDSEFSRERDIATALSENRTLQFVEVSERSWNYLQMPEGLRTLLSNPSIRQIKLHEQLQTAYPDAFHHKCPPEVKRRLCLVGSDGVQKTSDDSLPPVLLAANPFYHPMQNSPLEQRVAIWERVLSFVVYRDAPESNLSWIWHARVGLNFWFERGRVDRAAAHNLLLVSRDIYYGLVASLSRHLSLKTPAATTYLRQCVEDCPSVGQAVRTMLLDNDHLANDSTIIDELFRSTPNIRELDLGWLSPDAILALQRIGPIIGHSLRALTLSGRRGPHSYVWSKTDVFSSDVFAGFTSLVQLKVESNELRFSGSTARSSILPSLQELEVGEVSGSLLTLLAHAELPKLQSFTIRVGVRKADSFIKQHGTKLLHVHTTTGFNQKNLSACPNLQSLKLSEDVQPSFIHEVTHAHLTRLELNWATSGTKWVAKYREVCNSISPARFPALKEIVVARKKEIWPGNEREAKKSPWPVMATKLAEQGIALQDHSGRTWRQRLQVQ